MAPIKKSPPKTNGAAAKKPAAKKPRVAAASKAAAAAEGRGTVAKAKFSKALDEARSGAKALGQEMQERTGAYREKLAGAGTDWAEEAKNLTGQAKERATELAQDGKARASDAISGLGKIVADNAGTIDEKLGARYGDYARTAARTMQETAAKIEAKDLDELGEDAKQFVRKSPGMAIGIAALLGFMLSRLFKRSGD
jgi:ElaB/YqjD/DUF883 family membrane-anchored ribosome-binding protein